MRHKWCAILPMIVFVCIAWLPREAFLETEKLLQCASTGSEILIHHERPIAVAGAPAIRHASQAEITGAQRFDAQSARSEPQVATIDAVLRSYLCMDHVWMVTHRASHTTSSARIHSSGGADGWRRCSSQLALRGEFGAVSVSSWHSWIAKR